MSRNKKSTSPSETRQPAKKTEKASSDSPETELLTPEVLDVLEQIPEDQRKAAFQALAWQAEIIRSPFLPPAFLKEHEEIYPGFQKEFYFPALQAESEHRRTEESKSAAHMRTMETRGQWFAGFIGVLITGFAGVAACLGHAGAAAAIATPGFTLLGASYLVPKYLASRRGEKSKPNPSGEEQASN